MEQERRRAVAVCAAAARNQQSAGEMKHCPIALLDARGPVVSIAVLDTMFDTFLPLPTVE
ncbi:hypothetical protein SynA15127_02388 [Synechococcus sp. A15-127]|uniref:hypothetical protein n=1 Tax=Synechococcus sp. A15-127 TaxID=1050624 RepID=UPI001647D105|nr:hypothetical protein [Synechococcus sp. A15-127]QNI95452.1 hypothetical protein SynA15127_02388 [Synechococcus sp. A15-127]